MIRRGTHHGRSRGQTLAEFALVFPLFMVLLGAVIQGAIWLWGQNTLTQVARDTVRWAVTQPTCTNAPSVIAKINDVAKASDLIGYTAGEFTAVNASVTWPTMPPPHDADPCPPTKGTEVREIRIELTHTIPVFFPFFPPTITTSVVSRVEPTP